ncbi:protein of unknown function (plasmid) [Cupriavidus taiwanensis]|uniref:Uncharacterized protein n=1 Tax=Cupriavidus taiwanensis TaxID=164546 RepID=A0A7Z7NQD5_9BURK|nr:hypothetical protein CBM2597_U30129 [Cupriavidus taiwanensis]SOZ97127.1 hypothetical protein CBM2598_U30142 [Cupriavidus taiwanensis]SPC25847.1 hypothetical protein CBM2594_U20034 [Cupriavidus taiwanensis]SPD38128.1 protein of unknown function [Cupriavidus taiwanensis]
MVSERPRAGLSAFSNAAVQGVAEKQTSKSTLSLPPAKRKRQTKCGPWSTTVSLKVLGKVFISSMALAVTPGKLPRQKRHFAVWLRAWAY